MAKRPIDRRVARTRGLLQQAHISLILKKGYDAVTVDDICDAANVGRSTFYAHYTGKDDLRRSGLEHLRKELVGAQKEATIRQILSDLIRNELAATAAKASADAVPRELVVQYVVGAFMSVMTWWLDGGAKLPPHRIDAMFRRLATEGITMSYS